MPAEKFTDDVYDEVVGSGLGVDPLVSGPAEGCANTLDEHDIAYSTGGHGFSHQAGTQGRD